MHTEALTHFCPFFCCCITVKWSLCLFCPGLGWTFCDMWDRTMCALPCWTVVNRMTVKLQDLFIYFMHPWDETKFVKYLQICVYAIIKRTLSECDFFGHGMQLYLSVWCWPCPSCVILFCFFHKTNGFLCLSVHIISCPPQVWAHTIQKAHDVLQSSGLVCFLSTCMFIHVSYMLNNVGCNKRLFITVKLWGVVSY